MDASVARNRVKRICALRGNGRQSQRRAQAAHVRAIIYMRTCNPGVAAACGVGGEGGRRGRGGSFVLAWGRHQRLHVFKAPEALL